MAKSRPAKARKRTAKKPAKTGRAKAAQIRRKAAPRTKGTRKGRAARKAKTTLRAARPACPICGSTHLEVIRKDSVGKMGAKVAASAVVPLFIVEPFDRFVCLACAWRGEVTP